MRNMGRPPWRAAIAALAMLATGPTALAALREVGSVEELKAAIVGAGPGDRIQLAPGRYRLPLLAITRPGTESAPITLTAAKPDETVLEPLDSTLIQVRAPHWHFEALGHLEEPNH